MQSLYIYHKIRSSEFIYQASTMPITPEQVRDILNSNDGNHNVHIASFAEIKSTRYRCVAFENTYLVLVALTHA